MNWLRIFCLWLAFFLGLFPYAHGVVPPPRPHYIYDVRYYGAKGDGVTNDQTAIENALIAAATTNGVVHVPEGVYLHDSVLVIPDSVTLMGFGELRATDTGLVTDSAPQHAVILSGYGAELKDVTISTDWAGSSQSNNNGCGVLVNAAHNFTIDNVKVRNSATAGILSSGGIRGSITGCFVKNTLKDGIHMTNVTQDVLISGNRCDSTGDDGIAVVSYVSQGAKCNNIQITGNEVKNGSARGISVVGGNNVTISDNTITNIVYAGLYIGSEATVTSYGSTNIQGSNNTLDSTGASSPESYASIQIYGRADYPTENVKFEGGSASNCRYIGVTVSNPSEAIDSTTKNVKIIGMTITGAPGNNGFGLYAAGGTDITFQNNTVDHFASYGFTSQAGEGAGDIRIIGNTFRDVDTIETGTEDIISLYNATYDAAYVMLNGAYEINDSTERFLQLNVDSIPTYYFYSNEMGTLPSLPTQSILPDTLSSSQLGTVLTDEVGNSAGAKVMFSKGPNFLLLRGNNPTPTDEGDVQWDSSDHMIVVGNGGAQSRFPDSDKVAAMIGGSGSVTAVYDSTARGHASGVNDTVWIDTLDAVGGSGDYADTASYLTTSSGSGQYVAFSHTTGLFYPVQDSAYDLGDSILRWKDMEVAGTARIGNLSIVGTQEGELTFDQSDEFSAGDQLTYTAPGKLGFSEAYNAQEDTTAKVLSSSDPPTVPSITISHDADEDTVQIRSSTPSIVLYADSSLVLSSGAGNFVTLQGWYNDTNAIFGADTTVPSDTDISWFAVNKKAGSYDTVWLIRDSIIGGGGGETDTLSSGAGNGTDNFNMVRDSLGTRKEVRQLKEGSNITLSYAGDTAVTIAATGSGLTMDQIRDTLNSTDGMLDHDIINVERLDVDSINGTSYGTIDLIGKVRFRLTDTSGTDSSITAPFADTVNTEPDNNDVYAWNSTSHRFEIKAQTGGTGETDTVGIAGVPNGTTGFGMVNDSLGTRKMVRQLKAGSNITLAYSGDTSVSIASTGGSPAAQSITKTEIDSTASDVIFDDAYRGTSAVADSAYATEYYARKVAKDSATAYANAARAVIRDTIGLTGIVGSTSISDQSITKSDIDSTASNVVFDDAYRGSSAFSDSAYGTEYYARAVAKDSATAYANAARAVIRDTIGLTGIVGTTSIANQTITKSDIDTTSSNFVFDVPYKVTSATSDSMLATQYYALNSAVASSRITDQTITKSDIDSTSSNVVFNDAYKVTSATTDSMLATQYYALNSAVSAARITDQVITKSDIDTTASNFIFDDAYRGTSASADSAYGTEYYARKVAKDSATAYANAARAAIRDTIGLTGIVGATSVSDQSLTKSDLDTTAANFVFDDAYRGTSAVADSAYATERYARKVAGDSAAAYAGSGGLTMAQIRDTLNGAVGMNDKDIIGVERLDVDSINTAGGQIQMRGEVGFFLDTGGGSYYVTFDTTESTVPAVGDVYAWDGTHFEIQAQAGGALAKNAVVDSNIDWPGHWRLPDRVVTRPKANTDSLIVTHPIYYGDSATFEAWDIQDSSYDGSSAQLADTFYLIWLLQPNEDMIDTIKFELDARLDASDTSIVRKVQLFSYTGNAYVPTVADTTITTNTIVGAANQTTQVNVNNYTTPDPYEKYAVRVVVGVTTNRRININFMAFFDD